jgi:hypothetical protein
MSDCVHRAVLVITRTVEGTTTSVARARVELRCGLPAGHGGHHRDRDHGESWEDKPGQPQTTLLRHEDESGSS